MKQLIILLLLIIAFFIGYGQYTQYKRFNSPNVDYKTTKKIDLAYHNQETVINYYKAVEDANSFVKMQWTVNNIDVRTPEDDTEEIKWALKKYSEKIATIKYYEDKLENSTILKAEGLSNKEVKYLEQTGVNLKSYNKLLAKNKIKSLFNADKEITYGKKSSLIYEVQKELNLQGFQINLDGFYKTETLDALKKFQEKNNLFADGVLNVLTLDALFK